MRKFGHWPFLATFLVLAVLFATASILYDGFFSWRVVVNLFGDNAFLGLAAIGMTFVILSGGIDLSVGSMLALHTVLIALLVEKHKLPPGAAFLVVLVLGTAFGGAMGFLIQRYELPPFLVTLGGMFLARGLSFMLTSESLGISHPLYEKIQEFGLPLSAQVSVPATALIFLGAFAIATVVIHRTRFGRNVFATGGNENSARLMGVPVRGTRMAVYAISGFFTALAAITATFYMGSGNPALGVGFELDVIAAVVIGGTLLTGGVGTMAGTLTGVLIFGTIQTALNFDGRLNSWWLRIAIGTLLLVFILFQRFLARTSSLSVQNPVSAK